MRIRRTEVGGDEVDAGLLPQLAGGRLAGVSPSSIMPPGNFPAPNGGG
jgi:hypothetical protein